MKKFIKALSCLLTIALFFSVTACKKSNNLNSAVAVCAHSWVEATCSSPETCSLCNITKGDINVYAHTGTNTCSLCGINYYNTLINYITSHGKQSTTSGGMQCYVLGNYSVYISGHQYTLDFTYLPRSNEINCCIADNDYFFTLSLQDAVESYEYYYLHSLDFLSGTVTAKNFTKNTTSLPYDSILCLDGNHTNKTLQYVSCEYLGLLLIALDEFMANEKLGINMTHFGFINNVNSLSNSEIEK